MSNILKFLYLMNLDMEISDNLIIETFKEILNMKNKNKSNIFISSLFTYLMLKKKESNLIEKLLKTAFEIDNFVPYNEIVKIDSKNPIVLIAGSGKKGIKTINVSTTASIIASSLGANIIKPCSMATSSMTGSYDFLNYIGVNTNISIEKTKKVLNKSGFGIFPIEKLVPKFDKVYGDVFYAPNILSYGLAALICPIKPEIVLYGLANDELKISGDILSNFGVNKYRIVSNKVNNIYFMDELNVFGESKIYDSHNQEEINYKFNKILNLPLYDTKDIKQSNNMRDNIKKSLDVLKGKEKGAYEDLIALNAGNILQLSGLCNTIQEGYYIAKDKIENGDIIEHLRNIIISGDGDIDKFEKIIREE